jgi:hypothetical protein
LATSRSQRGEIVPFAVTGGFFEKRNKVVVLPTLPNALTSWTSHAWKARESTP